MKVIVIAFFFVATGCNSNNFLYLETQDEDTKRILNNLIVYFNASVGCEAWSLSPDKVKLFNGNEEIEIERRKVVIVKDTLLTITTCKRLQAGGCYDGANNTILIREILNNPNSVLIHEIGHAMGLGHETNSIMNEVAMNFDKETALNSLISLLNKYKKNQCWQTKERQ